MKLCMDHELRISFVTVFILAICIMKCTAMTCLAKAGVTNMHNDDDGAKCFDEIGFQAANVECRTDLNCSTCNLELDYNNSCIQNCSEYLSWKLLDTERGILEVTYELPQNSCSFNSFCVIALKINDDFNETTCNPVSTSAMPDTHSCRQFRLDVCCGGTAVMTFKNVFTGCYQFEIYDSYLRDIHFTNHSYIVTDYKETRVSDMEKNMIFDFSYSSKRDLTVKVEYPFIPSSSKIILKDNVDFSMEYECDFSGNEVYICKACMDATKMFCQSSNGTFVQEEAKCSFKEKSQKKNMGYICEFLNMPPSNYCVKVIMQDDICQQLTLWEDSCSFYNSKSVTEIDLPRFQPPEQRNYFWLIFLFSAIVCSLALGYCIVNYKPFGKNGSLHPLSRKLPKIVEEYPTVVLLYARDCPLFMEAMAQFRTVLSIMGCRVYDYWDPERFGEVSETMTGWVKQFLQDKDVRFVVAVTPIAQLLDQSTMNGRSPVQYIHPKSFDNLFLYTFKCLEESYTESYRRIFVVRLHKNPEIKAFTTINPINVFSLPTHLDKLVHTIKNKPFGEFTDIPTVNTLPAVQELNSLLLDLEMKTADLDYIYDIIVRDESAIKIFPDAS